MLNFEWRGSYATATSLHNLFATEVSLSRHTFFDECHAGRSRNKIIIFFFLCALALLHECSPELLSQPWRSKLLINIEVNIGHYYVEQ